MAFINPNDIATIREALICAPQSDDTTHAIALIDKAIAARADDALRARAEKKWASDDLEIDDVAGASPTDNGCWVQAWVYVRDEECDCGECGGTGRTTGKSMSTVNVEEECPVCDGAGRINL